jgi:predicted transposase/invertase (TIGR01784 family)
MVVPASKKDLDFIPKFIILGIMDKNVQNAATGGAAQEQAPKYDEGYKDVLSNKSDFLHFLKKYIAAPWTENISPDGVEKVDTSFTTDDLKHVESDLIYKLKINGSDVYFYILIELQSRVDFTMPFRLLRYMMKLLEQIFQNTDKNERERKGFRLPAIVPIILYNGYDLWTVVRTFRDYTENGNIFGSSIIDFEYLLFDLKRKDDNFLSSPRTTLIDIIFALDRNRLDKNDSPLIAERLDELVPELEEDDIGSLLRWMNYVYLRGKMSPIIEKTLKESIKKKGKGIMKHAIEVMLEERDKDIKIEAARKLLDRNMKPDEVAEIMGLMIDDVLRLQQC